MSAPSCRRLAATSRFRARLVTLRVAALRVAGVLFLRTLFWADCRAQIVGPGAHQAAFRAAPSLTRGVITEHGWRYHHEGLDRVVHRSPER